MYKVRNNIYFCLAVFMLGTTAAWLEAKSRSGELRQIKKPLPILKPLINMDTSAMSPYAVAKSERLPPEVIENLGTNEYVNWTLVDRRSDARSGQLSVTYYTGVQDQIPHVPEECLYQNGGTQDGDDTISMYMKKLGENVAIRRISFRFPRRLGQKLVVYYTICVNGTFCSDRNTARFAMANLKDSHLYYSKVEVALDGGGDADIAALDKRAAEILDRALSELRKSHWPPKGSERGGPSVAKDATTHS